MSLYIASLNSGSNGNCYYIGNDHEAVFVDAGISCAEIERRMDRLGIGMEKIKAVFISHEHTDHILGLPAFTKKYQVPVYITTATYREARFSLDKRFVYSFQPNQPVHIGNLSITGFPKLHDAIDPHSFVITHKEVSVGVFTDIGKPCEHVIHHFKKCHAAFLETNYDEEKLARGRYPYILKTRIRGDRGHLSNMQALELFLSHRPAFMSHLLLSHLSQENNRPEIAEELFLMNAGNIRIVLASRNKETDLIRIENNFSFVGSTKTFVKKPQLVQLSLF